MRYYTQEKSSSLSVSSILGIVFIVLKLIGTIDWSWWYVLMPFYLFPSLLLLTVLVKWLLK